MNNDDILKQFNEIVEKNDFDFSDPDDEMDAELKDSEYDLNESVELNYIITTVMQQIAGLIIDFQNQEKTGWLDEESAMLLRELSDICEQVIDRTFDNDCECDE